MSHGVPGAAPIAKCLVILSKTLRMTGLLVIVPSCLQSQMTISGRVTGGDQPVQGASVGIPDLAIFARTTADGRYNLLIRSADVRGQTVTIVARHSRYGSQSAELVLTGGSVERDFVLTTFERPVVSETPATDWSREPIANRTLDTAATPGLLGPTDVASALAGRIPGLTVVGATGASSSALMVFRGARSIAGSLQPLVVVDGAVLGNASSTTASQQFGLGGFDYGSPLQDLAIDDIATIRLMDAASAVPLYGSRAANGVLIITTKQAGTTIGLRLSATQRFTTESPSLLPSFQNRYGQGLGGQFEFFDGQGGGINDAVDQSWGPSLDGQPIAQSSLSEPRRPDVRYWFPHAASFRNYFESGRTIDANVALQGSRSSTAGRAAVNARSVNGLTPGASARRVGLTANGVMQPSSRFSGRGNVQVVSSRAENRPGTGFDEVNPVAGFTRMGRQIDLEALRSPIMSGTEQVSWIYTTRNNPFFQSLRNSNDDSRTHVLGSGLLRYGIGAGLDLSLNAGVDDSRENRNVDVATGWKGTYPTALGRRDFSAGGSERRTLNATERFATLAITSGARPWLGWRVAGSAGLEKRSSSARMQTQITDTTAIDTTMSGKNDVTSFYALGSASGTKNIFVDAGVRLEKASSSPAGFGFAVFPAMTVTYDLAGAIKSLRSNLRLDVARLRASWWRAGNELTQRTLLQTYAGGGTAADPSLGLAAGMGTLPERTTGLELATEFASANRRVALELTTYSERSREVLLATSAFVGQTAEISNRGNEVQLRLVPVSGTMGGRDANWEVVASLGHNANRVDRLRDTITQVVLAPPAWGASFVARRGEPLGAIVGTRYLRDSSTRALILVNGLPRPDAAGPVMLGSSQPDWTTSVRNRLRIGAAEVAVLWDARIGGKVFSATNLWGSYAGTLESTLEGRESGLTIAGIDSTSKSANTIAVTTEDYFHSLGAIHEAWVYDAGYWKLREARITYAMTLRFLPGFRDHILRVSLLGRNLMTRAKAPNIDPEAVLSAGVFQGFEMGQLPGTRSLGFQLGITP